MSTASARPLVPGGNPAAEEAAELQLYELLGQGSLDLGRSRLDFFETWFMPVAPAELSTGWALWRRSVGWRRFPGRPPY